MRVAEAPLQITAIRRCGIAEQEKGAPLTAGERFDVVLHASQHVGRPVFYAMAIIVCAFVPVFALSGQEGKLFHPLAFAKTFAMTAAALLSITLVPARLHGYELIESGVPVVHHNDASSTIKSDAHRRRLNDVKFAMNEAYYRCKWGGPPGAEEFSAPWNL